jgi:hypothetical protein
MIMLRGQCGRITLQLGNIKNNTIFFLKTIYILKSNLSLTHIKYIVSCRLRDFWYKVQKKLKNMLEIMLYQAGITWRFGGILGRHTSWRIYGRSIFSTWCPSGSHDAHSLVPRTRTEKFTVWLPHTPTASFHSLHMWSRR